MVMLRTAQHIIIQEHSENGFLFQIESVPDPEYGSGLGNPNTDEFQNIAGNSLSKGTSVIKVSWRSDELIQRIGPNSRKSDISITMLKNPLKNS